MSSDDYRAMIDAHREAKTCSICKQHLDYSQGYHSVAHAHWDCHKREDDDFKALISRNTGSRTEQDADLGSLEPATIKGNPHRTHLLAEGSMTAICGAKPGVSKGWRMRRRSGWYIFADRTGPGRPMCTSCEALELGWLTEHGRLLDGVEHNGFPGGVA